MSIILYGGFMNNLKETLLKFSRGVTKTSGEMIKSTKLALALSSEEDKLKQVYIEIGKKTHEIYQYGGTLGKFFDEKYVEIQQIETAIQELKTQMDTVKGVKSCPKCDANVQRNASFCPKCGHKMNSVNDSSPEEPLPKQENSLPINEEQTKEQSQTNSVLCRHCQSENEQSSRFCLTCGRIL